MEVAEETGYSIPSRTLSDWHRRAREGVVVAAGHKNCGRRSALCEEQGMALAGHVLAENDKNKVVTVNDAITFAGDVLGVKVSSTTVTRVLHQNSITNRISKTCTSGSVLTRGERVNICFKWLKAMRNSGNIPSDPSLLGSIDFTFTRHTTFRLRTLAAKGG